MIYRDDFYEILKTKNKKGKTPLQLAIEEGHIGWVEISVHILTQNLDS